MNQQIKIEYLKSSDIPEVLELFIQVFKDYPLIPASQVEPELNKMFLEAIFEFYRGIKDSMFMGLGKKVVLFVFLFLQTLWRNRLYYP